MACPALPLTTGLTMTPSVPALLASCRLIVVRQDVAIVTTKSLPAMAVPNPRFPRRGIPAVPPAPKRSAGGSASLDCTCGLGAAAQRRWSNASSGKGVMASAAAGECLGDSARFWVRVTFIA